MLHAHVLIPVAAAFSFLGLATFIASGGIFAFDQAVVLWFRREDDPSTAIGPRWFYEAMRDMTALGSFVGLGFMTISASLTLWLCRHRRLAVGLVVSVISALAVSVALKIAIGRARPDVVEHLALSASASFPSGHAFMAAATLLSIAGVVGLAARRADITRLCVMTAWTIVVLIGVSRIYLGVHWPTDVIAGWCLGIAWSSLEIACLGHWLRSGVARRRSGATV